MDNVNDQALFLFQEARKFYLQKDFIKARKLIETYRKTIKYEHFPRADRRNNKPVKISVVIISYGTGPRLFDCLDSLYKQTDQDFEIILVDNGGNEEISSGLATYSMLHIFSPINLLPSEGRNVGAYFASGENLIFLDDDAWIDHKYISTVKNVMSGFDFLALRGKILSSEQVLNSDPPWHYDLGPYPLPAVLLTEGNMVIRKNVLAHVGGFDPLMFGREGTELTHRCLANFPGQDIYYWPSLVIYHDFASGERLKAKRERQALAQTYLEQFYPGVDFLSFFYRNWYNSCPRGFLQTSNKVKDIDTQNKFDQNDFKANLSYQASLQRHRADMLQDELNKLQIQFNELKNSLSFKVGTTIREALESPISRGLTLPYSLLRLILNHKKENK